MATEQTIADAIYSRYSRSNSETWLSYARQISVLFVINVRMKKTNRRKNTLDEWTNIKTVANLCVPHIRTTTRSKKKRFKLFNQFSPPVDTNHIAYSKKNWTSTKQKKKRINILQLCVAAALPACHIGCVSPHLHTVGMYAFFIHSQYLVTSKKKIYPNAHWLSVGIHVSGRVEAAGIFFVRILPNSIRKVSAPRRDSDFSVGFFSPPYISVRRMICLWHEFD